MDHDIPSPIEQTPPQETGKVVLPQSSLSFWDQHRLSLLLTLTVLIAIVFVTVGMVLYTISGAAQLDLSRPGYKSVSDQVERTDKVEEYSASGPVNKETINEFITLFDEQAKKTKSIDAFRGDPLNPDVLFGSTENKT